MYLHIKQKVWTNDTNTHGVMMLSETVSSRTQQITDTADGPRGAVLRSVINLYENNIYRRNDSFLFSARATPAVLLFELGSFQIFNPSSFFFSAPNINLSSLCLGWRTPCPTHFRNHIWSFKDSFFGIFRIFKRNRWSCRQEVWAEGSLMDQFNHSINGLIFPYWQKP